jgi:hypothetical protein
MSIWQESLIATVVVSGTKYTEPVCANTLPEMITIMKIIRKIGLIDFNYPLSILSNYANPFTGRVHFQTTAGIKKQKNPTLATPFFCWR